MEPHCATSGEVGRTGDWGSEMTTLRNYLEHWTAITIKKLYVAVIVH